MQMASHHLTIGYKWATTYSSPEKLPKLNELSLFHTGFFSRKLLILHQNERKANMCPQINKPESEPEFKAGDKEPPRERRR